MDSTYPTPAGGEIVDGIYELVRFEVYSPASADENLRGRLLKFENGTFYSAMRETRTTTVIGGSYTTSGDTITLEIECPQSNVIEMKYTVSGDEFWFHDTSEPNVQAYVRLP